MYYSKQTKPVVIEITRDNFAHISCQDTWLFNLLKRSFTRKVLAFNHYYKTYEKKTVKSYSLINDGKIIKVKAGLIDFLKKSLDVKGISYTCHNSDRASFNLSNYGGEIQTKLSDSVTLYDYQKEAVSRIFSSSGFCCAQLPTGTGKTEVAASIFKTYLKYDFNRSAVYVVPTIKLQKEAQERFSDYNIACNTNLPFRRGKVNILTYASLMRSKIDYRDRDSVGCIVFDEAHHLKGAKSSKIIHSYKKLNMCIGLSATLSDNIAKKQYLKDLDENDLAIFGCLGFPVYYKEEKETIDKGFVVPIEIHVVNNKEKVYLSEDEVGDWHKLKRKVLRSDYRAELCSEFVKYFVDKNNLNTVCLLIPELDWSRQYMAYIAKAFLDEEDTRIILTFGGDRYEEILKDGRVITLTDEHKDKAVEDIKNPNVRTIFSSTSYFYEGVNIKGLQAIINVYGGRSTTRIKQQAGRVMRLFGERKDVAYICEFYDRQPVLESQLSKRLELYKKVYNANIVMSDFNH